MNKETDECGSLTDLGTRPACPHPRAAGRPAARGAPDTSRLPAGWLASRAAHRRPARRRPRPGDHWQTIRSGRRAVGWADVDGVAVAQPPPPPPPLGQSLAEKVTVALVSWSDPCTTYPSGGVMRAAALTAYWLGWHAALLKVEAWLVSFTTRGLVRGLFGSIGVEWKAARICDCAAT